MRPGFALFIPAQSGRIEMSRIAFYVQRARLRSFVSNVPMNSVTKPSGYRGVNRE